MTVSPAVQDATARLMTLGLPVTATTPRTVALLALEALAFAPASAPQLARYLGVDPRTARRLLAQLHADEWVEPTNGVRRRYRLTGKLLAVAAQAAQRSALACAAAPVISDLRVVTGCVAMLATPSYGCTLVLVYDDGRSPEPQILSGMMPAHCTAAGQGAARASNTVALSGPQPSRCARTRQQTLVTVRPCTPMSSSTLARGFAVEDGEYQAGLCGIAAPVRVGGDVTCAVAIRGSRWPDERSRNALADTVLAAAARVGALVPAPDHA